MALYIQSANALVSRVAQWVGAIPSTIGINATAYNSTTKVITCSANPTALVLIGDFIGPTSWVLLLLSWQCRLPPLPLMTQMAHGQFNFANNHSEAANNLFFGDPILHSDG